MRTSRIQNAPNKLGISGKKKGLPPLRPLLSFPKNFAFPCPLFGPILAGTTVARPNLEQAISIPSVAIARQRDWRAKKKRKKNCPVRWDQCVCMSEKRTRLPRHLKPKIELTCNREMCHAGSQCNYCVHRAANCRVLIHVAGDWARGTSGAARAGTLNRLAKASKPVTKKWAKDKRGRNAASPFFFRVWGYTLVTSSNLAVIGRFE